MTDVFLESRLDINILFISTLNKKGLNIYSARIGLIFCGEALLLPPVFERGGTYFLRSSRVISKADASAIEITAIAATIAPDEPIPGEHHFVTSDDTILGKSTTAPLDKTISGETIILIFQQNTLSSYQQGLGTFGYMLKMPDPITQKLCLVRQRGPPSWRDQIRAAPPRNSNSEYLRFLPSLPPLSSPLLDASPSQTKSLSLL